MLAAVLVKGQGPGSCQKADLVLQLFPREDNMTLTVFDCTMCGQCCQGQGGIVVSPMEQLRLAEFLHISVAEFCALYTIPQGNKIILCTREDEYCIFFDPQKACTVHPAKPDVCRAWPFFRGNLVDQTSWELAQDYCSGIKAQAGHEEFARQGLRYLVANALAKKNDNLEATALQVEDLVDKN
jgi:Fe-S-cluster containining protein